MELLVILIFAYACKKAFTDTKHAARAAHAARNDLGWAWSQLAHGFPATRHGFAQGWHESRQAHHEAMAGRQEAKTKHLETKAGLVPQLQDYRARQQAALEQIRSGKPAKRRFPVLLTATSKSGRSLNPLTGEPADRAAVYDEEDLQRRLAAADQDPDIDTTVEPVPSAGGYGDPETAPTRRVDGQPETGADTRFFDRRESGYTGPIDRDGNIPAPDDPDVATLEAMRNASPSGTTVTEDHWDDPLPGEAGGTPNTPPTSTASTEGNNAMPTGTGEITYEGVLRNMDAAKADAEQKTAEADAAARDASDTAEQMQALDMDPATLGAMADHLDAHAAAQAALARVQETAETVQTTLSRGHSGLNEAHQNAPVDAADKQFYAG